MADVSVELDIPRPPAEVRAWWTDLPDVYVAQDPREQPHRIEVVARSPGRMDLRTYWRGPAGRDLRILETFHLRPDGWDVDVGLPLGLAQRDAFTLTPTPKGTRVRIEVDVWARSAGGRIARPFFLLYARRSYPATWRSAAKICARDAPRLG